MRGLGARLVVSLAALALIVMIILDVAFLLWAQQRMNRERALTLRAAAYAAALLVKGEEHPEERLAEIAASHEVILTIRGRDGTALATSEVEVPADMAGELDALTRNGYAHVFISVGDDPRWEAVIASQSLQVSVDRVLSTQRFALGVLLAAALVLVTLGLFFLRRTVLRPIARLTALVGASDYAALAEFGRVPGDGLALLSRAVIGMSQRIREDRERIAAQLTELTAAHEALHATQDQLLRSERLAVVGTLAAGLAHEIGNPLAVVRGFVEVLQAEPSVAGEEQVDKALKRMGKELDRIQATIRQLLDFSRASASAPGAGEISAALLHVEGLLAPQERMRGIELVVERPPRPQEAAITTDALTQVLLNLALNAADAMAGRGRLRMSTGDGEDSFQVVVDDSGPGIAVELRQRIFEPFYTTKPAGTGTGLGLSVCERIVTAAGGDISIEDSPSGGARVVVTLPKARRS